MIKRMVMDEFRWRMKLDRWLQNRRFGVLHVNEPKFVVVATITYALLILCLLKV